MELYGAENSGNAYKIRLFLALLGLAYDSRALSLPDAENRTEAFLALNPRGQIPVLVDAETTVWDSQAILVYLARRYGAEHWLPTEATAMARVMQWMAVAENECLFGLARARAVKLFGRPWDLAQCQSYGRAGLEVMDAHLADRDWLASGEPTIADIACYPYVGLAPAGEIPLDPYARVRAWMGRVQRLPGYVDMPGIERVA